MPKELTHWILAERALAGLEPDNRLHEVIRTHHGLYLAGAVLPDTLLHLALGRHASIALALAHRFHDSGGNSYTSLIRAEEVCGDSLSAPLLACLMGVLSHMEADICFHPFVFALGGTGDIGPHYRMETALDTHFLINGVVPPVWRLDALMTPDIRNELVRACILLFDPKGELPRQELERTLQLHCRIQARYDSTPWKIIALCLSCLPVRLFKQARHLFYPIARPAHDEFCPTEGWRHPVTGEERHEAPDDLADKAVARTITLFRRIDKLGSLKAALGDLSGENLLTGLHGVKSDKMGKRQE